MVMRKQFLSPGMLRLPSSKHRASEQVKWNTIFLDTPLLHANPHPSARIHGAHRIQTVLEEGEGKRKCKLENVMQTGNEYLCG